MTARAAAPRSTLPQPQRKRSRCREPREPHPRLRGLQRSLLASPSSLPRASRGDTCSEARRAAHDRRGSPDGRGILNGFAVGSQRSSADRPIATRSETRPSGGAGEGRTMRQTTPCAGKSSGVTGRRSVAFASNSGPSSSNRCSAKAKKIRPSTGPRYSAGVRLELTQLVGRSPEPALELRKIGRRHVLRLLKSAQTYCRRDRRYPSGGSGLPAEGRAGVPPGGELEPWW